MTQSIIQLPDEPIVIVTIRLPLHDFLEDIAEMSDQVAQLLSTTQGLLYCIVNISKFDDMTFSDILLWLGEQRANRPGSVLDPRVKSIAVGSGHMMQLALHKLAERTGIIMPLFETLDEALAFARAQIAQQVAK